MNFKEDKDWLLNVRKLETLEKSEISKTFMKALNLCIGNKRAKISLDNQTKIPFTSQE